MHGYGTFRWPDGRVYRGNYALDAKEGYGVFEWPDGRKYEGNWHSGVQHGEGVLMSAKGKRRKGYFENGKRVAWIDQIPPNSNRDYSDSAFDGRNSTHNKSDNMYTLGEESQE